MKQFLIILLLFYVSSCNVIPLTISPADHTPMIPFTPTSNSFPHVTNTPTIYAASTQTNIPASAAESPVPAIWSPAPTPELRANTPLPPGQPVQITSMQLIDAQTGWGFDSDDHILRTRDGGKTWQDVTPPLGVFKPAGFFALNANTAWATFSQYEIGSFSTSAFVWRTTDGGTTWMSSQTLRLDLDADGNIFPTEFYLPVAIQFVDAQTGWLLANTTYGMNSSRALFFHTDDGGVTWRTINDSYSFPGSCVSVGFAFNDAQTGWAGGNCFIQGIVSNQIGYFLSSYGWTISKTTDGGYTYDQKTSMPVPPEFQGTDLLNQEGNCGELRIIAIAPNVIGIEWGCSIFTPLGADYVYFSLSADGGQTWNSWKSSGNEAFLDADHGWRLLSPRELQQTINGGLTWNTIKSVMWGNAQFYFISEQEGWALTSNNDVNALLRTTDGGHTWIEIEPVIAMP